MLTNTASQSWLLTSVLPHTHTHTNTQFYGHGVCEPLLSDCIHSNKVPDAVSCTPKGSHTLSLTSRHFSLPAAEHGASPGRAASRDDDGASRSRQGQDALPGRVPADPLAPNGGHRAARTPLEPPGGPHHPILQPYHPKAYHHCLGTPTPPDSPASEERRQPQGKKFSSSLPVTQEFNNNVTFLPK